MTAHHRQSVATCEYGFWEPEVSGCPVCGPEGPCTLDPDFPETIRAFRRSRLLRRVMIVAFVALVAALVVRML